MIILNYAPTPRPTSKILTYTVVFNSTALAGDWKLYGKDYNYPNRHLVIQSWTLKFSLYDEGTTNVFNPPYNFTPLSESSYTNVDTMTVPYGPHTRYNGDLYLVVAGVNATETVMLRATDYVSPSLLSITNLPSYVPYEITHGDFVVKDGMTDSLGRINIPRETGIEFTEPVIVRYWPNSLTYVGNHHAAGKSIMFDTYNDRVISFPWDPNDPLVYVAKAYVRMTIPVDDMSLDGIRLYNKAGQHVSYPYLTGTYNAGDEVFIPVFVGATEIHLKINGDWVQSYVKDMQQNTRARVLGGTGSIEGVELSETATIFATKPGDVLAFVTITATGSGQVSFFADYHSGPSGRYSAPWTYAIHNGLEYETPAAAADICTRWQQYVTIPQIADFHQTMRTAFNDATSGGVITVSAYHNGMLVTNTSSTAADSNVYNLRTYGDCTVLDTNDGGVSPFGSNPWSVRLVQSVNFTNEELQKFVRIPGLEAGDQVDFVIHSGADFKMQNPMPYAPLYTRSSSSGEFVVESGYIIIYQ